MQHWDLRSIDAPRGTRDPYVVHQDEGARAVLVSIDAGQALGDHQVKENAWGVVVDGGVRVGAGSESGEGGPGGLMRSEPGDGDALASQSGARVLMLLAPWPGAGHY